MSSNIYLLCDPLCPFVRNQKNIVFKGKKYPIDFDSLIRYSNYYYNHRSEYEKTEDIIFPNEPIEIDEEAFQTFLKICQGEPFNINYSNFFIIRQLSYIYDIPGLKKWIENYIKKNPEITLKASLHNLLNNKNDQIKIEEEEKAISDNFLEIIENEDLLKLRVPTLFRILTKYNLHIDQFDDQKQEKIIDFLFKYLDVHKKEGSVLFMCIKDMKINTMLRLIENYSDIFDFNMINNKSLLKIALDSTQNSNESKSRFINHNKIIFQLVKKRINEFNNKIDDFTIKITTKLNQFDSFINKVYIFKEKFIQINEKINRIEVDVKNKNNYIQELQKNNEKMSQIVSDINTQTFLTQDDDIYTFNKLKGESQFYFITKINEKNQNEQILKITNLLQFLSNEHGKVNYSNNNNNYVYITPKYSKNIFDSIKDIESIEINSYAIETLYKNGSLDSSNFIDQINNFENIVVEILYPSNNFENIYNCLMNMKKEKKMTCKIGVHYIKYENCYYFQKKNKEIYSVRLDCEEILGGSGQGIFEENKSLEKLIITDKVRIIGDGSFFRCTNLKNIIFGKNITKIGNSSFSNCTNIEKIKLNNYKYENTIYEFAFHDCSNLKHIECNPYKIKIDKNSFAGCNQLNKLTYSSLLYSTYKYNLVNYERFTEIIIPDSVEVIGSESFKDFQFLETILIPSSVTIIDDYSFCNCKKLTQIKLSSSLTSIGKGVFSGCSSLKQIEIPQFVKKIGDSAFSECKSLKSITFVIPSLLTDLGSSAFDGCSSLEQILIPCSVLKIKSNSFRGCTSLNKIGIHSYITEIGDSCFEDCKSLTGITFRDSSVKLIGKKAFKGCILLNKIEIHSFVTEIGDSCFEDCKSLAEITFKDSSSVKSIGQKAFKGCSSLKEIIIARRIECN